MAALYLSSYVALGLWLVAVLTHDLLKGHIQPQDLHRYRREHTCSFPLLTLLSNL